MHYGPPREPNPTPEPKRSSCSGTTPESRERVPRGRERIRMCYVGKATKIFFFMVAILTAAGLILGFALLRHGKSRHAHGCDATAGDQGCGNPSPSVPDPIPANTAPSSPGSAAADTAAAPPHSAAEPFAVSSTNVSASPPPAPPADSGAAPPPVGPTAQG